MFDFYGQSLLIVDCASESGQYINISFSRVPSVITKEGKEAEELSKERRSRWSSAISRDECTESILKNDCVCSKHFVSGKASEDNFRVADSKVSFYTGLPSFEILSTVFCQISPFVTRKTVRLTPFEEFVLTLMKLRLNMPFEDLANQFGISVVTV